METKNGFIVSYVPNVFTFAAMNEKLDNLLTDCAGVFMRYGIKSITMDDMARHLGISKKTIYQFVSDKNDLVVKVLQNFIDRDCCFVTHLQDKKLNAIDENYEVLKHIINSMGNIHPSVSFDLAKYHPEANKVLEDHKHNFIISWHKQNIEKGMKEGLYRADLKADIAAHLFTSNINIFISPLITSESLLKEYKFQELYLEVFRYHIRGIASAKGLDYLIEKVKIEKSLI